MPGKTLKGKGLASPRAHSPAWEGQKDCACAFKADSRSRREITWSRTRLELPAFNPSSFLNKEHRLHTGKKRVCPGNSSTSPLVKVPEVGDFLYSRCLLKKTHQFQLRSPWQPDLSFLTRSSSSYQQQH